MNEKVGVEGSCCENEEVYVSEKNVSEFVIVNEDQLEVVVNGVRKKKVKKRRKVCLQVYLTYK
ncbi:hypothetical protein [Staphylococcus epidermidis]|uniref:hypothetical protein n=1 Tax=Staphylococcus epidermidis TaxID=1282 RepID=UPI0011A2FEE7|nr:hypothetical protein [Staphylococcus epidermidis]